MADTPHRRPPASSQHVSVTSDHLQEVEMEEAGGGATSAVSQPVAPSGVNLDDADLSMSAEEVDDDDLLDDDEEYEKDMAMQRREDVKNGHILEENPLLTRMPKLSSSPRCSPEEEDSDRLHSLAEIEERRDQFCARLKHATPTSSSQQQPTQLSLRPAGRPAIVQQKVAAFESIITHSPSATPTPCTAQGEPAKPDKTATGSPSPIILQKTVKKGKKGRGGNQGGKELVLYSTFAEKGHPKNLDSCGDAFHEATSPKYPAKDLIDAAKKTSAASIPAAAAAVFDGNEEREDLMDHFSQANKLHTANKYLIAAANTMHDAHPAPLLSHSATKPVSHHLPTGTGSVHHAAHLGLPSLGQVHSPSQTHNAHLTNITIAQSISHTMPIPPQPNYSAEPNPVAGTSATVSLPSTATSLPLPSSPLNSLHTLPISASQPQLPTTHINLPSHKRPPQSRNKIKPNKATPNKKTVELASTLFSALTHPADLIEKKSEENPHKKVILIENEMADFPPLQSRAQPRASEDSTTIFENAGQVARLENLPRKMPWLAPPAPDPYCNIRDNSAHSLGHNSDASPEGPTTSQAGLSDTPHGRQPSTPIARTMTETLRMGQPAEGPIFLDRDNAEKRGEVRIVEGKPCLFFSANETSLLAGRLGPAIVGKFSHSIPPAHQIQKALGNIKFVGQMTWNFLNAKHIFIRLSDMRDYVKILNGPNNSHVWYIDHHPMRVFKWTPDFDPFFESPITTAWCNIISLPIHLFEESSLIAIGEMLGTPVQVDRATISRSRVSFARICVEIDLSRPIVEEIDINIAGKQVTLKVKWDKVPKYCSERKHVGHSPSTCYASGKRPSPPKRDYTRGPPPPQPRPPPPQPRPTPTTSSHAPPSHDPQASAPSTTIGGQPRIPHPQPSSNKGEKGSRLEEKGPRPKYVPHATPIATVEIQASPGDFSIVSSKKRKPRSKAARRRNKERQRTATHRTDTTISTVSDGLMEQSTEDVDSSTDCDRGHRSVSPPRSGDKFGPLAMVLHSNNMFGALEDDLSDDCALDDEPRDLMMEEANIRQLCLTRPLFHLRGPGATSSPSQGATPKRARRTASTSH